MNSLHPFFRPLFYLLFISHALRKARLVLLSLLFKMFKLRRFGRAFNNFLQIQFRMNQIETLFKSTYSTHKSQQPPKQVKQKEVGPAKNKNKKQKKTQTVNEDVGKFQIKTPKGTRDYLPSQMAIRRTVIDQVVKVFKKHGAVEIDTPVFQLKDVLTNKYGEDSKLIYDLKDQGGEICSLRYDLTVPFARFMAMNTNIQKIKRFHIGKVYRRDQPTINKGRFRQFYQCDFDIAGNYDAMIPDAEVLSIMQQILQSLGVKQYIVKVNHRKILQAMIKQAECNPDLFKTICSSIDKLDKLPWNEVKSQLVKQKGLTQEQADILGKLTTNKGNPKDILDKIKQGNVFKKTLQSIQGQVKDMEKLFSYLGAMDRIQKVSFDLSLARGLDYYTGLIYEIVLTDKQSELGSISGGGRYDNLIGMFSTHQIPSVGGSLGIQRLFTILQKHYSGKTKENEVEILVATIGKIPAEQKFKLLGQLWKNDIKAETLYVEKAKPDKQITHAFNNQIPMILWLGQDELKSGNLNLKILYKREQVKVKLENIGQSVMPYVLEFRKDFEMGNVDFKKK